MRRELEGKEGREGFEGDDNRQGAVGQVRWGYIGQGWEQSFHQADCRWRGDCHHSGKRRGCLGKEPVMREGRISIPTVAYVSTMSSLATLPPSTSVSCGLLLPSCIFCFFWSLFWALPLSCFSPLNADILPDSNLFAFLSFLYSPGSLGMSSTLVALVLNA